MPTTHTKDAIEELMATHEARIAVLDKAIDEHEKALDPLKAERANRHAVVTSLRGDRNELFPPQ